MLNKGYGGSAGRTSRGGKQQGRRQAGGGWAEEQGTVLGGRGGKILGGRGRG